MRESEREGDIFLVFVAEFDSVWTHLETMSVDFAFAPI